MTPRVWIVSVAVIVVAVGGVAWARARSRSAPELPEPPRRSPQPASTVDWTNAGIRASQELVREFEDTGKSRYIGLPEPGRVVGSAKREQERWGVVK